MRGGEVQMQAALKVAELYPNATFVMVGGLAPGDERISSKAKDMADFMKEKLPGLKLEVVSSLPSTKGNLVALFNVLGEKIKPGNFIFVVNDFRVPRISEFWSHLQRSEYPSLPKPEFLTVSQLGMKEFVTPDSPEYLLRLAREKEGIEALRSGSYKHDESRRLPAVPPTVDSRMLLTPAEFARLNTNNGEMKMK